MPSCFRFQQSWIFTKFSNFSWFFCRFPGLVAPCKSIQIAWQNPLPVIAIPYPLHPVWFCLNDRNRKLEHLHDSMFDTRTSCLEPNYLILIYPSIKWILLYKFFLMPVDANWKAKSVVISTYPLHLFCLNFKLTLSGFERYG